MHRPLSRVSAVAALGILLLAPPRRGFGLPETGEVGDREQAYQYIQLFTEVLMQIRSGYVDDEKTGYKELVYGALSGMLKSLDPHSQFMPPTSYNDMKEDTAGKFSGIGIHIGMRDEQLTVIAPIEDTPAFRAGIEPDDRIIAIDGKSTEGMDLPAAVSRLRGEKGTTVRVKIRSAVTGEEKEHALVRDDIKIPSVKGARMMDGNIGYIRITQFNEPTADSLQAGLEQLLGKGMKALVLDLRGNPGGLLKSAIDVSQKFLKPGDLIVSTKGPRRTIPAVAAGPHHYPELPLAILVNRGSASASEIVAGALQDQKRAVLIGQRTFGKGTVQSILPMSDGSAIRLTTAKYFTPSKRVIHDNGIEPDIYVSMTPDEWRKSRLHRDRLENPELFKDPEPADIKNAVDPQLQRAMEVLTGIVIFRAHEHARN